ncbi:putative U2 small nuclear ribonucleoprotein [Trypoxylus dichotomus]
MKEREEAKALFKGKKGKEIQKEISKRAKTFVPGGNIPSIAKSKGLSDQEIRKIREAISKASSLEEVERLQKLLQAGHIPDMLNGQDYYNKMEVENGH